MAVDETQMTKEELLANIEQGWNDFQDYLSTLTYEQVTTPTDPAGWTPKDHIAHLAIWEDSLNALLEKKPRREYMGIEDADAWNNHDWDKVNAVIQQRYHDLPLADIASMFAGIHERLLDKIMALPDAELQRPYKDYQADWSLDVPIIHWLIIETYEHYDEHKDYISVIVQKEQIMTKEELLAAIEAGWNDLQTYLGTLSYEQATVPTDAAGWTVKDHLMHLAVWEDSMNALLEKQSRREQMGIDDEASWKNSDFDKINAVIQQRYKDLSLGEVAEKFFKIHERLIQHIDQLADEDLQRPYNEYQPDSTRETPIIEYLKSDTFEHYAQHKGWIDVIAQQKSVTGKADLLTQIEAGWNTLNAYLGTLSDDQLAKKTDAAGWTVKDHVIHMAIWEDGMYALLERLMRVQYMGIDEATWERGETDAINAVIQQRYKDLLWTEVELRRQHIHQRLIEKIGSLSDEDLQRPYRFYETASMEDRPVINWLVSNTFAHYAEHLPWIKAIAENGTPQS